MIEIIRKTLRPFWKIAKASLLKCGVPLETLLRWKSCFFSILYRIFPFKTPTRSCTGQFSGTQKWSIEHASSLTAQTDRYWNILNDEWNKNI